MLGTAFRKNISGHDIPTGMGDEVIPPGAFIAYHTADVSLNPTIYADPLKWDPSRYLPDRAEGKNRPHSYIGWGSGRHPCRKSNIFDPCRKNFADCFSFLVGMRVSNPIVHFIYTYWRDNSSPNWNRTSLLHFSLPTSITIWLTRMGTYFLPRRLSITMAIPQQSHRSQFTWNTK